MQKYCRSLYESVDWNSLGFYLVFHWFLSLSIWERGLKLVKVDADVSGYAVALYMRAWIEIHGKSNGISLYYVALYMRAWIEIITEYC